MTEDQRTSEPRHAGMDRLFALLAPPVLPDAELQDTARFLNSLAIFVMIASIPLMLASIVANPVETERWLVTLAVTLLLCGALLIGIRRGRVVGTGTAFVWLIWAVVTVSAWGTGGVDTPALGAQYLLVVLIATALGRGQGTAALIACALTEVALAWAETRGLLPSPVRHTPLSRAVSLSFFVAAIGALLVYFAGIMRKAMRNARGEADRRAEAEAGLRVLNAELEERERRYRLLVEDSPEPVFVHSRGAIVYANRAAALMAGASSPDEVLGLSVMSFVHPDSLATVSGRIKMMLEEKVPAPLMLERFVRLDGTPFYAEAIASPLVFEGAPAIQVIMRDQTQRHATEEELQFRSFLLDGVMDGIIVRDATDLCVLYVNEAMCSLSEMTREQFFASHEIEWVPLEERETIRRHLENVPGSGSNAIETAAETAEGARIPVEVRSSRVTYLGRRAVLSMVTDISERKAAEEAIAHMALHDPLTGLANRALLKDRLEIAIAHARRAGESLALIFLDIDNFKAINDTAGHGVGDLLLQGVAERLRRVVRADDTVARFGGDEFTLLLPDVGSDEDACRIAEKVLAALREPFTAGSREVQVTASLGIVAHHRGEVSAEEIIRDGDLAMYAAKESGRNAYRLYDPAMNESAMERFVLRDDLLHAIERNELSLHYQPIVRLRDRAILGAEALCRWDHGERGPVSPVTFIPLAEESGMITTLGRWVLKEACTEAKRWADAGHDGLRVAVNLSPRQLYDEDLVGVVRATLDAAGLPADLLELEITETVAMQDAPRLMGVFRGLRDLGVRIAIDDFGTGYSSLDYLKRFPIDTLKVDRTFVKDVCEDPDSLAIASTIVSLAAALRLDVVAEGVETEDQCSRLIDAACPSAQGFLFRPGVPAREFRELLSTGLPGSAAAGGTGAALVRWERPSDIAAIRAVNEACFPTADEARLVDTLRDAGHLSVSLVAEVARRVVGHVAFSPVETGSGAAGLGLAPLSVLEPFRRRGIAAALVDAGLQACRDAGCGWVVVLGEPAYYARFGFRPAREAGLSDEYGGGDAFQVLELVPGALPVGAGLVRYGPEFADLG